MERLLRHCHPPVYKSADTTFPNWNERNSREGAFLAAGDYGVLVEAAVSPGRRDGRVWRRRDRGGRTGLPAAVGDQRSGHGDVDRAVVVQGAAVAQLVVVVVVVVAWDVVVAELRMLLLLLLLELARQRRLGQRTNSRRYLRAMHHYRDR